MAAFYLIFSLIVFQGNNVAFTVPFANSQACENAKAFYKTQYKQYGDLPVIKCVDTSTGILR